MGLLPALQSKDEVFAYFSSRPTLLESNGSSERCFRPEEARHFIAALQANGISILGFEVWRKSHAGYNLDIETIWHSHGSDSRWNFADALDFLRNVKPMDGDLFTIQF